MGDRAIRIHDHTPAFLSLDDAAFTRAVDSLAEELCRGQPLAELIRNGIARALRPLERDPDRQSALARLATYDLPRIADTALDTLVDLLPPPLGRISCHLIPSGGTRGSGVCFARDALLVAVPCNGDVLAWLPFVIAHEYSHTIRGFGEHAPETIRDHLIFEGLAMVLAETLFPLSVTPYPWSDPAKEEETAFWTEVDPGARGEEARSRYVRTDQAYAIGARIVRHYLRSHNLSVAEAHARPSEELYWQSHYPFIR